MDERILGLAGRLGKTIAESKQATDLREIRKAFEGDPELQQVMKEYRQQAGKMQQLEQERKPVEPEDKHKLEELNRQLAASETFKKYTAAQVEYVDLLRRVNEALQRELVAAEGAEKKQ